MPPQQQGFGEVDQEKRSKLVTNIPPGEEIVISGIAGSFPESHHVQELADHLFNKESCLTNDTRRWDHISSDIPDYSGKIPDIEKFDAGFFGIPANHINVMDPGARVCMEKTIEAIFDAGMHPSDLEGKKCGIFLSCCISETAIIANECLFPGANTILGSQRFAIANRLSLFLKIDGPSYGADTACSTSLKCFDDAYLAMRLGYIDSAIVVTWNLTLDPLGTLQFARLGVLNYNGECRIFDEGATGYSRAEGAIVFILQKAKDAKRIYAKVIHSKTNCDGFKEQGITFPNRAAQEELMREVCEESGVDPTKLFYMEAHGTGTKVGDVEEAAAIDTVFCKTRKEPLLVGSVKSNLGHSEPSSGLTSLTKVIIAMETGLIPPNINFNQPRKEIDALTSGRIKVITEATPVTKENAIIGVNSFGFGGLNVHSLVQRFTKTKENYGIPKDELPRLLCISGRTEECVELIMNRAAGPNLDAEFIGLLHNVFRKNIEGHLQRGYIILNKIGEIERSIISEDTADNKIVIGFGNLDDSWKTLGKQLLAFPLFAGSIYKIHNILAKKNVNITEMITNSVNENKTSYYILGNLATQIGIADILKTLGATPNGVFGDSLGEFVCAYFDGVLTLEETILMGYELANTLKDTCEPQSTYIMELNGEKESTKMPADVEEIGIISDKTSVISGKSNSMKKFVGSVMNKNVEVMEVSSNKFSLSKDQIKKHESELITKFKKIVKQPRKKNYTWHGDTPNTIDAQYFVNALTKPKNFKKLQDSIQNKTIVLEIGLGQISTILRNSFDRWKCIDTIQLNVEVKSDKGVSLLSLLGSLYKAGCALNLAELYPKVDFPVSRGTSMVSPYIRWLHNQDWTVYRRDCSHESSDWVRSFEIDTTGRFGYVGGHVIDGLNLVPATCYLNLVYEAICIKDGIPIESNRLILEDCRFHRATTIPQGGVILLDVMIHPATGNFEVSDGLTSVVTGRVKAFSSDYKFTNLPKPARKTNKGELVMATKDVYKELRLRGYNYREGFRAIVECDNTGQEAKIQWDKNFVTFMDNMLQMKILQMDTRQLYVPTYIQSLAIDGALHFKLARDYEDGNMPVFAYADSNVIRSGAIEIRGLKASNITRRKPLGQPILEKYDFIPNETDLDLKQSVRVNMQIVLDVNYQVNFKVVELVDEATKAGSEVLAPIVAEAFSEQPLIKATVTIYSVQTVEVENIAVENKSLSGDKECLVIIGTELLSRPEVLNQAFKSLEEDGFVLSREPLSFDVRKLNNNVDILTVHTNETETLVLLKKNFKYTRPIVISVDEPNFSWLEQLKDAIKNDKDYVIYSQNVPTSGIIGLTNCIRKEAGGKKGSCFFINDPNAPAFDLKDNFYKFQLEKGLPLNVFKNGKWGTYKHLLLDNVPLVECEQRFADTLVKGDLSSLNWIQGHISRNTPLTSDKIFVDVHYAALNFKDVMTATGRLNFDDVFGRINVQGQLGIEFSGITSEGRKVVGLAESGGFANLLAADKDLLIEIPDKWSLEEAVTVPAVYGTVLYAVLHVGGMKKGDSILIHSGSGGVGQAAINVATHLGCTVFTTVGTPEKRKFIKEKFPHVSESHIGNSRDTSFEQMVLKETNGKGVDFVLNSLTEEKLFASVRCLAQGGKFLEIGKYDLFNNAALKVALLEKEGSYHGVMIDMFFRGTVKQKRYLNQLTVDGMKSGMVKPLNRHVFMENQVEEAFRFMTSGKHIGKVLVKIEHEENGKKIKLKRAIPRHYCDPEKSIIICGGLGGFGLELADWLILRGARKVVLTSRTGISNGYQASRISKWKTYGVQVVISTDNICTEEGCLNLIKNANALGPVEGIYNLAVILRDALLENQTVEGFKISFAPKADATRYLDEISRKLCPELKNFVIFSSVSCGRGNMGQTNYGMANSVMERICEKRKAEGYPALAIQWGAIGDVGLVADMQEEHKELEIGGTLQQKISNCLEVMDQFLKQNHPIVASMVVAEKVSGVSSDNCVDAVANILGINNLKTVSYQSTLAELGMDSMRAIEVKQTLEREFDIILTAKEIRNLTFSRLQKFKDDQEEKTEGNTDEKKGGVTYIVDMIGDDLSQNEIELKLQSNILEDMSGKHIVIFPGIEGVANVLKPLSAKLNCHVTVLQFAYKSGKNIHETAQRILPCVEKGISKTEPFRIIAYSFGGIIALEVVSLLESKGYMGNVILIESMPSVVKYGLGHIIEKDNSDTMLILKVMGAFVSEKCVITNAEKIYKSNTLEDKIKTATDLVLKNSNVTSSENLYQVFLSMYTHVTCGMDYEPEYPKIKSPVILFKASEPISADIPDDYGIQKLCEHGVKIYEIEGNHSSIVNSNDLADAINEWLTE